MSILQKALKKAEQDRAPTRCAAPPTGAEGARPLPNTAPPHTDTNGSPSRSGKGTAMSTHPKSANPQSAHRGIWISLALAVFSAVGFGYWMSATSPPAGPQIVTTLRPLASSPPLPSALRMNEAGPLELRLDRSVETLGIRRQ